LISRVDTVQYDGFAGPNVRSEALGLRRRKIASALEAHVAVIVAPTGFGKSSAAIECLRAGGRPFEILSLRHAAAEPESVAARLRALASFRGHVIVEGCHLARCVPGLSAAIVRSIEDTAAAGPNWVLTSRDGEGLPVATWTAHGLMNDVVREADLRLRLEECCVPGAPEAVAVAYELTSGWPIPFRLALAAAASLEHYNADEHRRAAASALHDYVSERVLTGFDDTVLATLAQVALYDGAPVDVLAGHVDRPAELMERLRRTTAFVSIGAAARIRVEPVVREHLLRQLQETGQLTTALESAARAAANPDEVLALLGVAVRNGSREAIAAVLVERGLALVDAAHVEPVRAAIARVRRSVAEDWRLALLHALVTAASGDLEQAEAAYGHALGLADGPLARLAVLERHALTLVARDRIADRLSLRRVVGALQYTLEHDGAELGEDKLASALALCGAGLALTGRADLAAATLERVFACTPGVSGGERAVVQFAAAVVTAATGCDAAARAHLGRAVRLSQHAGRYGLLAYCHSLRWRLAVERRDEDEEPRAILEHMRTAGERAGDEFASLLASMRMYLHAVGEGDMAAADGLRRKIVASRTYDELDVDAMAFPDSLRLASEGAFKRAFETLAQASPVTPSFPDPSTRRAALALFAAAAGSRDEALRLLGDIGDERGVVAAVFVATTYILLGQSGRANAELVRLERSRNELRPRDRLLADGARAFYLACELGTPIEGASRLRAAGWGGLAAIFERLRTRASGRSGSPIGALTKTELLVLREIAVGGTNAAVALRLGRSVNTVNVHVASILRKLECGTRHDAIRLAHELGLVTFSA
jgi:ATP/maltotriose-dependent transcriptional regulator MalT